MSSTRLLYSKAEIRILAGAPGALARPPNLLALVDRSKYEKHISPDRGHSTGKSHHKGQKQRSHVSTQISPQNQRWKPKHNEQKLGMAYTTRHWDQTPAAVEEDEEPEWADEVVNFDENFDFSQATLERDKDRSAQPVTAENLGIEPSNSTPKMSRFGFALEDTLDAGSLSQMQQHFSSVSEQVLISFESSTINQVRQSRFKFKGSSEQNAESFSEAFPDHSSTSIYPEEFSHISAASQRIESSHGGVVQHQQDLATELLTQLKTKDTTSVSAHPNHIQSRALNIAAPTQSPTVPKGKPIELSQMFQMYALANNLPAPSAQPMRLDYSHSNANDTGVHISSSPSQFQSLSGGPNAQLSHTVPAALYNPVLPRPPPPGLRGIPSPKLSAIPVRPLSIAGLGPQNHPAAQAPQQNSTRSKSSSNDKRRGKTDANAASSRTKAPVPAATAPPSYVRSYMNIQLPQQSSMAGYYVPPGMSASPAQGFIGQHMPYPPPPPPAPY